MRDRLRSRVVHCFLLLCLSLSTATNARALTIKGNFIGGQPNGATFGGGNPEEIFRAAARVWEQAIKDDFTVTFDFGWGTGGGGSHQTLAQGGTPNRETYGLILFNNSVLGAGPELVPLFLDPSPDESSEFPMLLESSLDLGGGSVNVGRTLSTAGFDYQDLFSVILHEIGHGLGLALGNSSFIIQSSGGSLTIQLPLPFAGSVVPLASNNAGTTSHLELPEALMGIGGIRFNSRILPSDIDILVMAQLSGFRELSVAQQVAQEDDADDQDDHDKGHDNRHGHDHDHDHDKNHNPGKGRDHNDDHHGNDRNERDSKSHVSPRR